MKEIELTADEIELMHDILMMVLIRTKQGTRNTTMEDLDICEGILTKLHQA